MKNVRGVNMRRKRKIEKRYYIIIFLAGILLILGLLIYFVRDKRNPSPVEQVLQDTILFVQKIVATPIRFVTDSISEAKEKNAIYKTYKTLQENEERINAILAKNKELESELLEMQSLLELNQTLVEGTYLYATVSTRNIDTWYQTIQIDKGKKHGVETQMAVVTSKGIIGEVIHVSNFNSTVKLFTGIDSTHKVSVKIEAGENYIYGLLSHYDAQKGTYIIEGIAENTEIEVGASVITTGMGNLFPAGILLGTVSEVTKDHFDLARTVLVKPSVNFDEIRYVSVLKK